MKTKLLNKQETPAKSKTLTYLSEKFVSTPSFPTIHSGLRQESLDAFLIKLMLLELI